MRTLDRAEEHALSAILWQSCFHCPQRLRQRWKDDVQLALSVDPNQPQAASMAIALESFDAGQGLTKAQALVAARPEYWLSWVTLGVAAARANKLGELIQSGMDPGEHAYRLAPRQPYAVLMKAWSHAIRGERHSAIDMARRAQRLQPTNAAVLLGAAELLAELSACAELAELAPLIGFESDEGQAEEVQPKLDKLTAQCGR